VCNVTLGCVFTTIVAVEKQNCYIFRVCVCSLKYALCNAHAPYCHTWLGRLGSIFPHYLVKGPVNVIERKMCVLIFSRFVRNISLSKKKGAKYDQKCIFAIMYTTRYSFQI
jgi:hypothetical protein